MQIGNFVEFQIDWKIRSGPKMAGKTWYEIMV